MKKLPYPLGSWQLYTLIMHADYATLMEIDLVLKEKLKDTPCGKCRCCGWYVLGLKDGELCDGCKKAKKTRDSQPAWLTNWLPPLPDECVERDNEKE